MSTLQHAGIMFNPHGVFLVGNANTGAVAGLSQAEALLCSRYLSGDMTLEELSVQNKKMAAELNGMQLLEPLNRQLRSAYLHVTQRCNLECAGCYSRTSGRNCLPDPSMKEIDTALAFLADAGIDSLNISGGEPFLRADLQQIIRSAKVQYGIKQVNVLTNGTILDRQMIAECAPYTTVLSVSFDGASPDDPSHIRGKQLFEDLVSFVSVAQNEGIEACITPTLHMKNWKDLRRYHLLADKLGTKLNVSILSPTSRGKGDSALFFDEETLRRLANEVIDVALCYCDDGRKIELLSSGLECVASCGAGCQVISIDADGEVYPCHLMHEARFSLGNVFRGDDIVFGEGAIPHRLDGSCKRCEYRYLCGGGCLARAVGENRKKDPYCEMHKQFYRNTLNHLARQFKED